MARVVPYYCQRILPPVLRGERVLVAAHGNSLRALAMVLDRMTPESVTTLRTRHRRAGDLHAQRGFHGEVEGHGGVNAPLRSGALSR